MTSSPAQVRPWRVVAGGLALHIRLTPRASRDEITGTIAVPDGLLLAARVRAVPEKGAANAALVQLVADAMNVPLRAVSVAVGGRSRLKVLLVQGHPATLEQRIAALAEASASALD